MTDPRPQVWMTRAPRMEAHFRLLPTRQRVRRIAASVSPWCAARIT
jgi:hypothetical protein